MLSKTCDTSILIEYEETGRIVYRRRDGRRWIVLGICTNKGYCYQGAVNPKPELDCPVTPEFKGCCDFTYIELNKINSKDFLNEPTIEIQKEWML